MAAEAGWYPDPEGDATRLRYWDGTLWTNSYTTAPSAASATPAGATAAEAQGAEGSAGAGAGPATSTEPTYTADYSTAPGQAHSGAQGYTPQGTYGNPAYVAPAREFQMFDADQIYPMTSLDRTLRLVAFVFNVLSCVGFAILIIPLAWMVPMTVISWGIYKGTKRNTTAFGICSLIFLNTVSGILYLISNKDE